MGSKTDSVVSGDRRWWVSCQSCLTHLQDMPDDSVDCCVTSPPYFGLRDYGTAVWEGGKKDCEHSFGSQVADTKWAGAITSGVRPGCDTSRCKKCGAVRVDGQIGLEASVSQYIESLVKVFDEVRRVLRPDGTCFVNLGDSYVNQGGHSSLGDTSARKGRSNTEEQHKLKGVVAGGGIKNKDLCGVPWTFALAARASGWWLRQEIIWQKPNPTPESVTDRCVRSTESVFLLTKSPRYYWNHEANQEPAVYAGTKRGGSVRRYAQNGKSLAGEYETRTTRNVWTIKPSRVVWKGVKHFAAYPPTLVDKCLSVGCRSAGVSCDCDEVISTPTGEGDGDDPTMSVGRAGLSRQRRTGEGVRPVTRREQRWEADQLRRSPHRAKIEEKCGEAFAHYIRKDRSGARPVPPKLRDILFAKGILTKAPPCSCEVRVPLVYDPFTGSGTTGIVTMRRGLRFVGSELNADYAKLARERIEAATKKTGFFY